MSKKENKREPLILVVGMRGVGKKYVPKENEVLVDVPYIEPETEENEEPAMVIMREIKLSRHDLYYLHDGIIDLLDGIVDDVTDEQIVKLLTLHTTWDGVADTLGKGEVLGAISQHFIGMDVPMYKDGDEYFNKFYKSLEDKKEEIIKFIS